jgi:hypothetical protein
MLDLGQLVGGDEDRPPLGPGLLAEVLEFELNEGVQAGCRFVQDEELGSDHEGSDQADLLLVAARQALDALARVELEPLDELVAICGVDAALEIAQVGQQLLARQLAVERQLAGDVADSPVDCQAVLVHVEPEHLSRAARRPNEIEQQADRRRLARAVRPQEPEDLARLNDQIHVQDSTRVMAVPLGQLVSLDCGRHRATSEAVGWEASVLALGFPVGRSTSHRSKSLGSSRSRNAYISRTSCSG